MNCPNCNTKLSCGCQKRTASNGATVCSTCLGSYEAGLKSGTIKPSPTTKVFRPLRNNGNQS